MWILLEAKVVSGPNQKDFIGAGEGYRFHLREATSLERMISRIQQAILDHHHENSWENCQEPDIRCHYLHVDWRSNMGNAIFGGPGWFVRYRRKD